MQGTRARGQVLILLASWMLFSGGAASALVAYDLTTGELRKSVKRSIADEGRRKTMLQDIRQWESIQKLRDEVIGADREEILRVLRRQNAQPTEVEPVAMKLDETIQVMDGEFLDLRFRLKAHVTSEEWKRIAPPPNP